MPAADPAVEAAPVPGDGVPVVGVVVPDAPVAPVVPPAILTAATPAGVVPEETVPDAVPAVVADPAGVPAATPAIPLALAMTMAPAVAVPVAVPAVPADGAATPAAAPAAPAAPAAATPVAVPAAGSPTQGEPQAGAEPQAGSEGQPQSGRPGVVPSADASRPAEAALLAAAGAPALTPLDPAAAAPTAAPAAAPVAAPLSPPATPPSPPAVPSAPPALPPPAVPLHRAISTVSQLLQVAHANGVSRARLALKPADLGGIEIRLQTSSAGVTAQIIADSPEATRLLQQAGTELRRSLESSGVNLLSLDVSTTGEDRSGAAAAGFEAHAEARERSGAAGRLSDWRGPVGFADDDLPLPTATTLELPGGVLVDVLA